MQNELLVHTIFFPAELQWNHHLKTNECKESVVYKLRIAWHDSLFFAPSILHPLIYLAWLIPFLSLRFQVLTAASMKYRVFWDVAACSHFEVDRRFRGAYCLHHQDDDGPDDEGSTHLWNVDQLRRDYTTLHPTRLNFTVSLHNNVTDLYSYPILLYLRVSQWSTYKKYHRPTYRSHYIYIPYYLNDPVYKCLSILYISVILVFLYIS
jgi:hypothetical protein